MILDKWPIKKSDSNAGEKMNGLGNKGWTCVGLCSKLLLLKQMIEGIFFLRIVLKMCKLRRDGFNTVVVAL